MSQLDPKTKPLAYVLGQANFMGLVLEINQNVLIPRAETELLVEKALKLIGNRADPIIVDVGTGSGAIALAIKKFRPDALVYATDTSIQALKTAEKNKNKLDLDVNFIHGNLLDPINFKSDLIIANLPYLDPDEDHLPELDWEPALALFALDNGFGLIKQLLDALFEKLKKDGLAIIEIHPPLVKKIEEHFACSPINFSWQIESDFSLRPRFLIIRGPT